jgi:hypothetical protein
MVVFDEEKQDKKVEQLRKEEEEHLAQVLSQKYKVQYADLTTVAINSDAFGLFMKKKLEQLTLPSLILSTKK